MNTNMKKETVITSNIEQKVVITGHGRLRVNERFGVDGTAALDMATAAHVSGEKVSEQKRSGLRYSWLRRKELMHKDTELRVHKDKLFVFDNEKEDKALITVYPLPDYIQECHLPEQQYIVRAKCYVWKNEYVLRDFPVDANNASEAAGIVRKFGHVCKNRKDAIVGVWKCDTDLFIAQRMRNEEDEYLKSHKRPSKELIERLGQDGQIYTFEDENVYGLRKRAETKKPAYKGKNRIRNPKKFARMYPDQIDFDLELA